MGFLTIIDQQMCVSGDGPITVQIGKYSVWNLFSERHWPACNCPAYTFARRTINFGGRMVAPPCKHISEAENLSCGWHQLHSPEAQTEKGVCPKCGAKTVTVQVEL